MGAFWGFKESKIQKFVKGGQTAGPIGTKWGKIASIRHWSGGAFLGFYGVYNYSLGNAMNCIVNKL